MNGISTERFTYNANWLSEILPAFMVRFDNMGQENPQAPARIEEIHEAVKLIKHASRVWFNISETAEIRANTEIFEIILTNIIELDRNATVEESTILNERYMDVIRSMLDLATSMYPAKR